MKPTQNSQSLTRGWSLLSEHSGAFLTRPVVLSFQDKLWLFTGGHSPATTYSWDGTKWTSATPQWPNRRWASGVVHNNAMWVLGGQPGLSDVWNTLEGVTWNPITSAADWGPRDSMCVLEFKGLIWVFGGLHYDDTAPADVWSSLNGKDWTKVTPQAQWSRRAYAGATVFDNKMWMLGGGVRGGDIVNEVWWTEDGITWHQAPQPPWQPRLFPGAATIGDTMYLVGGTGTQQQPYADLWSYRTDTGWQIVDTPSPWAPRSYLGSGVFQGNVIVGCGSNGDTHLDSVYAYTP